MLSLWMMQGFSPPIVRLRVVIVHQRHHQHYAGALRVVFGGGGGGGGEAESILLAGIIRASTFYSSMLPAFLTPETLNPNR